jgi:uncharacterized protein YjbJ (UPF0337 family)
VSDEATKDKVGGRLKQAEGALTGDEARKKQGEAEEKQGEAKEALDE